METEVYRILEDTLSNVTARVDQAVTWATKLGPTDKERLTWTNRRVRIGSSGRGYNKRHLQTSSWFRTAAVICLVSTTAKGHTTTFDSDSVTLHVDNCASRCITHSLKDFVTPPRAVNGRVRGMGGDNVAVTAVGTIRWSFDDDNGMTHTFLIPGSLYIPSSPARLFSPQHWAQERKDDHPNKNGTYQATFADHVKLVWGQQKFSRQIPFDKSNVATFETSPECKNFRLSRACLDAVDDDEEAKPEGSFTAFDANLIVDDEDKDDLVVATVDDTDEDDKSIVPILQVGGTSDQQRAVQASSVDNDSGTGYTKTNVHHDTSFDHYHDVATIEDVENDDFDGKLKPTSELLLWHCRLGHVPFSRLISMAKNGLLPKRLSDCRIPKCAGCLYGKMTRRAKRTKNKKGKIDARAITGPGSCVSVNQLESRTLGLIGHMKGTPTIQRYTCATIYVDHFSRLSYVHLQKALTSDETVQGKIAFEKFCETRGVTVRYYHADNGRFSDKGFVNHVAKCRQSITYCGVNAHF